MRREHTCRTCMYFRAGAFSDMSEEAPIESGGEDGVCEFSAPVPQIVPVGRLAMVGMLPRVHASRSCQEYMPETDGLDIPCENLGADAVQLTGNVRLIRPAQDEGGQPE
ncbi:hypothetical protein EDF59_1285 [Novosphingobium sp. ST904]|nr:hypothetical protein EDF59_1285 [Novosphingobium sp. ST904]